MMEKKNISYRNYDKKLEGSTMKHIEKYMSGGKLVDRWKDMGGDGEDEEKSLLDSKCAILFRSIVIQTRMELDVA